MEGFLTSTEGLGPLTQLRSDDDRPGGVGLKQPVKKGKKTRRKSNKDVRREKTKKTKSCESRTLFLIS